VTRISVSLHSTAGLEPVELAIRNLVIAGWTGRDRAAVEGHIHELAALGVAPPSRTPVFYRVSASLLTTATEVQVLGSDSSGEAEFVVIRHGGRLLLGLGSDHTDRKAEATGVALSKQLCAKIIAGDVWDFADVEGHWDSLILRAFLVEGSRPVLYQEGAVNQILHPCALLDAYGADADAMFCGTLPAIGGVRSSSEFSMELEDPVLRRKIEHRYTIQPLPVAT
jgi:hypothetical protein